MGAGAGGHRDRGLGQAADDQEAAEQAAQNIGGPVGDELLVRIGVAAALHGRGLCPKGLGVANQRDGECAVHQAPEF